MNTGAEVDEDDIIDDKDHPIIGRLCLLLFIFAVSITINGTNYIGRV